MSHIFLSYSKKNRGYARKLADRLLDLGFDAWIDDRINFGDDWWELVVKSIQSCGAFVVLMTPQSRVSKWVQREVLLADSLEKPIFPLLIDGNNWEIFIDKQYTDVRVGLPPPKSFYVKLAATVPRRSQQRGKEISGDGLNLGATSTLKIVKPMTGSLPAPPDLAGVMPPPFDWCFIPAGSVRLAEVDDWRGRAQGGNSEVSAFYMARYPVTNAQFQAFVDAVDGYYNDAWWEYSSACKAWRTANPEPTWPAFDFRSPHPRVNVSWYEAVAFCQWLSAHSQQSDYQIMLPNEKQWQRAAIGDTGYAYPWGNEFDPEKCNTRESGIRQITPVTQYPAGASPFDVMDMSGNVCEWCLNLWGSDDEYLEGSAARCLRGGSWSNTAVDAQASFRDTLSPGSRFNYRGFRIAALPR